MTLANKERGEVVVVLAGREYVMRPTFEALAQIEGRLGVGIVSLLRSISAGQFGVRDFAAVIHAGIDAGPDRGPSYAEVGRLAAAEGLMGLLPFVTEFLMAPVEGQGKNRVAPTEMAAPAAT